MKYIIAILMLLCVVSLKGQDELSLDPLGFLQHRIALNYEHTFKNNNSLSFYAPFLECDNTIGVGLGCQYKIPVLFFGQWIDSSLHNVRLGIGGHLSVQNQILGVYGSFSINYKVYFDQSLFTWLGKKMFVEPKVELLFGSDFHAYIGVNIGGILSQYVNPEQLLPVK